METPPPVLQLKPLRERRKFICIQIEREKDINLLTHVIP